MTSRLIFFLPSVIYLVILTIQYPLATTFPIGGDAPRYIVKLLEVKKELQQGYVTAAATKLFTNTDYPGSQIIFATSTLLPISWPERFTWWIVLGYIATGITIGYLVNKIAGWEAGSLSIFAWAITGMAFTKNFEDGTLAQLLSLPFLLLSLYAFSQKKWYQSITLLIATYITHPLSIAIAIATILWTSISNSINGNRSPKKYWLALGVALPLALLGIMFYQKIANILTTYPVSDEGISLHDMVVSPIGPLLIIAPLGWLTLLFKKSAAATCLAIFFLISLVFFWHFEPLGGSIFLKRLQLYFAVSLAITAGIGLSIIIKKIFLNSPLKQVIVISLLFSGLGLQTWQQNKDIFQFYESPSRYERPHVTELAAFEWMRNNLTPGDNVITTISNRHTEWIPIISTQNRIGLKESHAVFKSDSTTIEKIAKENNYQYAIFLKKQEKPIEIMPAIDSFTTIFENDGVKIIDLE